MNELLKGTATALITPFAENYDINEEGLIQLLGFQKKHKNKCVIMGTTAESPAVDWKEHIKTIKTAMDELGDSFVIAGTGSNSTKESLDATLEATDMGVKAVLLVDCYYNKPSSRALFENYYSRIAEQFPETLLIPYIIPGRSVTELSVPHLIKLAEIFPNVRAVKEASGKIERMRFTRGLAETNGIKDFSILSGDDNMTYAMMTDEGIRANGVISVYSNIFPNAVHEMVKCPEKARAINNALSPLFELVGIKTTEKVVLKCGSYSVEEKIPNPEPVKALMNILGMPAGPCRAPLGGLGQAEISQIKQAALQVYRNDPELYSPAVEYFSIRNIEQRLAH